MLSCEDRRRLVEQTRDEMPGANRDRAERVTWNLDIARPALEGGVGLVIGVHADRRVEVPRFPAKAHDAAFEVQLEPRRERVERPEARQQLAQRARRKLELIRT